MHVYCDQTQTWALQVGKTCFHPVGQLDTINDMLKCALHTFHRIFLYMISSSLLNYKNFVIREFTISSLNQ